MFDSSVLLLQSVLVEKTFVNTSPIVYLTLGIFLNLLEMFSFPFELRSSCSKFISIFS
jgi:hypothetical protein